MKKVFPALIISLAFYLVTNAQDTIPKPVPPAPAPVPATTQTPPPAPPSQHKIEKRINAYAIYTFDDSYNTSYDSYNYYEGKIKGGMQYGLGLEFMVKSYYGIELLWIGQNTTAPTTYQSSTFPVRTVSDFDLNLNYAMLGFGRHVQKMGGMVEGYGGLMVGALFASAKNPDNGNSQSGTKFAWGARLGLNIWATDKFALKLQGQLLSAVQSVGGSLYFGTGGAGAGVSTYSSMLQFGVGGGITYKLGK